VHRNKARKEHVGEMKSITVGFLEIENSQKKGELTAIRVFKKANFVTSGSMWLLIKST
jgi:hypothetical protein